MSATPRLNILSALPYLDKRSVGYAISHDFRLLVDSGAFTAFRQNKKIPLRSYFRAIDNIKSIAWRYVALDVIGDGPATVRNYELALEAGYKPIPVFTKGQPPEVLDHYAQTSDYVAFGGLVGSRGNAAYLNEMKGRVPAGMKVHLLGDVSKASLQDVRPYSADASSWSIGTRYGDVQVYCPDEDVFLLVGSTDPERRRRVDALVRGHYGQDPTQVRERRHQRNNRLSPGHRLHVASHLWAAARREKLYGTKVFMAAGGRIDFEVLLQERERLVRRKMI